MSRPAIDIIWLSPLLLIIINYKLHWRYDVLAGWYCPVIHLIEDYVVSMCRERREESWLRSIHWGQSAVILIKTTELFLLKIPRHVPAREDWQYLMSTRGKLSNVITYIQLGEIQLLVLITQKIRGNTPECGWTENHRGVWVTLTDDEIKIMIPECLSPLRQI